MSRLFIKASNASYLHAQLLPEAISLDGSSIVQNQEFCFWEDSCAGFFGPKGVFWCEDNVQKVS